MHKGPLLSATFVFGLIGLSASALAVDNRCSVLIQQGSAVSVTPTRDIKTLQICLNSCDELPDPMSAAQCQKSLNNLYFSSVAQTIEDQLNTGTQAKQSVETNNIFMQLRAIAQQPKPQPQQQNEPTPSPQPPLQEQTFTPVTEDGSSNANANTTPPPVAGPSNDINW